MLDLQPQMLKMNLYGGSCSDKCMTLSEAAKCGTIGCALGWAWTCLSPKWQDENPKKYYERVCFTKKPSNEEAYNVFKWIFDYSWAFRKETSGPEHVVQRIDWLLENGVPALMTKAENLSPNWHRRLWEEIA